jgi:signal transduction histidine kinase
VSGSLPDAAFVARRLFGTACARHVVGIAAAMGMAALAMPLDRERFFGVLRLAGFVGAASLGSYVYLASRVVRLGRPLREAITSRAADSGAPPPDTLLVRSVHLMPNDTGIRTVLVVVAAALADATGLVPVSGLPMPRRLAADLVCVTVFQVIAHGMTIQIRRQLWAFLRELHPDDVTIHRPQRFMWRLASRVLSAALVPALCIAAIVLGRPGLDVDGEALRVVVVGMTVVALVAALVAIQIGRVAERDIRALATHVDVLLARGPIDAGAVSEWGEQPMSTNAAVELVDAIHVLAGRYARLASEEERARRAVEEAHMLRTRFMAYMSHDLRSPLNSITGFAEVLAMESEGPLNEEQMESVLAIRDSGQDLVRLVTNIVDAARLEAGRMTIFPAWTPAVELAEEAITRAQRGSTAPSPTVRIEVQPGLPTVYVDAERTTQALAALFFHLLREGEVDEPGTIRIRLQLDPGGASAVIMDVHGRGRLPPGEYARILDGFARVESTGGRGVGGMGIGLALCRSLIVVQGGVMWCEDVVPGEARFRIALPADPRALARPAPTSSRAQSAFD